MEFVAGWILGDVLGEGSYGEVRMVHNKQNGETIAMKIIDLKKHPDAHQAVKKETTIHKMLSKPPSNPHIIKYFGQRSEDTHEYIFLEYASGGELFDKIEPDYGMPVKECRKYFRQLISAVEFIHSMGIAHRDLKPENLLLDENNNLKVADFGLATVFKWKDKTRILDKKCGTPSYVAPEIWTERYHGEPADVWSCGIILVALLAGELPWDEASEKSSEYKSWVDGNYISLSPWTKLGNEVLSFIRKILKHRPNERMKVREIKNHEWLVSDREGSRYHNDELTTASQPEPCPKDFVNNSTDRTEFAFSQPTKVDDLLLCSQIQATQTQSSQANALYRVIKRMTRFYVRVSCENVASQMEKYCASKKFNYKMDDCGVITISIADKRMMPLIVKVNIIGINGKTLLDFRRSKGCGIEFKKEFIQIKRYLESVITTN